MGRSSRNGGRGLAEDCEAASIERYAAKGCWPAGAGR